MVKDPWVKSTCNDPLFTYFIINQFVGTELNITCRHKAVRLAPVYRLLIAMGNLSYKNVRSNNWQSETAPKNDSAPACRIRKEIN